MPIYLRAASNSKPHRGQRLAPVPVSCLLLLLSGGGMNVGAFLSLALGERK